MELNKQTKMVKMVSGLSVIFIDCLLIEKRLADNRHGLVAWNAGRSFALDLSPGTWFFEFDLSLDKYDRENEAK